MTTEAKIQQAAAPAKLDEYIPVAKPDLQIPTFDPWALENMVASEDFAETACGDRVILKVPVCKPHRQDFIRVHPDKDFRRTVHLMEVKNDASVKPDIYLIAAPLVGMLRMIEGVGNELIARTLYLYVNRQGDPSFWPVATYEEGGSANDWQQSALLVIEAAMTQWIKVVANMRVKANEYIPAKRDLGEPKWTKHSFHDLLKIAFRDGYIQSPDHAVIRTLTGA